MTHARAVSPGTNPYIRIRNMARAGYGVDDMRVLIGVTYGLVAAALDHRSMEGPKWDGLRRIARRRARDEEKAR